jgi:hypothetical protein
MTMVGLPVIALAEPETTALPEGFFATGTVRPMVEALWQRSPGFRSQVRRIVEADVRIVLEVVSPAALGAAEAKSVMVREHGTVRYVRLQLRAATDWVPLIPHELEHVLEAIEGIDLGKLADRSGRAWRSGPDSYETVRAQQAGHRIAREYRQGAAPLTARLEGVR